MPTFTLKQIAELLGAQLEGDPTCEIKSMASINNAKQGTISFLLSPKFKKYLETTQASALIVPNNFDQKLNTNLLFMANPNIGYAKLAKLFNPKKRPAPGIHPSAVVGEDTTIDSSASIGPNVVIGDNVTIAANTIIGPGSFIGDDCIVGKDCEFNANVTCYSNVKIGDRVVLHSGVVLGADGFGMINDNGAWQKIPQLGGVQIGNDVEIGANTTIDRGAIDDTIIEDGVKLDNLIMIGHNVQIGSHTAIAGQAGIAGSTKIGRYCMIGGQAGIADHLEIGDTVIFTAGAQVSKSITEPGIYSSGMPVETRTEWHRNIAHYRRLDKMAKRIKRLEQTQDEHHQDS